MKVSRASALNFYLSPKDAEKIRGSGSEEEFRRKRFELVPPTSADTLCILRAVPPNFRTGVVISPNSGAEATSPYRLGFTAGRVGSEYKYTPRRPWSDFVRSLPRFGSEEVDCVLTESGDIIVSKPTMSLPSYGGYTWKKNSSSQSGELASPSIRAPQSERTDGRVWPQPTNVKDLSEAVDTVNRAKRELGDSMVLDIRPDGSLRALVEY